MYYLNDYTDLCLQNKKIKLHLFIFEIITKNNIDIIKLYIYIIYSRINK